MSLNHQIEFKWDLYKNIKLKFRLNAKVKKTETQSSLFSDLNTIFHINFFLNHKKLTFVVYFYILNLKN